MAKFSERRRYVLRVIQPSTRSTLGEYDSRPPLARYVWYFASYLRSSCCSETRVRPLLLPVFLPLSTLDVTHVRKCTRPSPLYRTASDEKLGDGLGTRLHHTHISHPHLITYLTQVHTSHHHSLIPSHSGRNNGRTSDIFRPFIHFV